MYQARWQQTLPTCGPCVGGALLPAYNLRRRGFSNSASGHPRWWTSRRWSVCSSGNSGHGLCDRIQLNPPMIELSLSSSSINSHDCADGSGLVRTIVFFRSASRTENVYSESNRPRRGVGFEACCDQFSIGNIDALKPASRNRQFTFQDY